MSLVSNVTAPLCVSSLPFTVAPVVIVIDTADRMFPLEDGGCSKSRRAAHQPKDVGGLGPANQVNLDVDVVSVDPI